MQNRLLRDIAVLALCAALAPLSTYAKNNGNGKGKEKHQVQQDVRSHESVRGDGHRGTSVNISFSTHDRDMVREYYRSGHGSLPPGLAKRGSLPPGLRKHLRKNGTLPPGLQKKLYYFPDDLNARLAPLPHHCRRAFIDGAVVIVDSGFRIIDVDLHFSF
ncbi:MAG TPA: hypothetical protein VD837_05190 [Terriglobales bacterium]|nr:hypothetical protein [Terriglobales bacterium]